MKGWKTWASAAMVAVAAVLEYLGHSDVAQLLLVSGGAFGLVGLGHKMEKKSQ